MESYRSPKYVERYEDVIFELETPLNAVVPNNSHQKKDGYRFVVDNSGEVTPMDWHNARLGISFKVNKLADNAQIAVDDQNGIVNSIHSFISNLDIKLNGKKVYDCNNANHCVNIKSLLEYSPGYAQSTATSKFFHLDTSRSADAAKYTKRIVTGRRNADNTGNDAGLMLMDENPDYNKGFAERKLFLGTSLEVTRELPLNRYSFFEALEMNLLPSGRVEMNIEIESDGNLIWQATDNCRVIITKLQLIVPRITFNSAGQSMYMSNFLKPYKWTYLCENIERSNSTKQRAGHFKISSGISKPRHVFVFIINDADVNNQEANQFLYNTFSVSTGPQSLNNCHLEVGNGNEYPEIHYTPATDLSRVYRDVLKYVHKNNELGEGSLLNISNFQTLFPILYFDLTKQKADIRDGTTKLTFRYELSGTTATDYSVYALTLYEQEAELVQQNGKLLFR